MELKDWILCVVLTSFFVLAAILLIRSYLDQRAFHAMLREAIRESERRAKAQDEEGEEWKN